MSDGSKIEWTDATWNVVLGCDRVSPGCDSCYAIRTARRMSANPNPKIAAAYADLVEQRDGRLDWTGQVNLVPDRLDLPLHWTRPRRIFVNAQSDLFHARVPDDFIARVFAVMAATPQHTYQILTKRHGRMRSLLRSSDFYRTLMSYVVGEHGLNGCLWPLPNVHLGVSVEDQQRAELRIPSLVDTPAAVRFVSCEPLLAPVDLARVQVLAPRPPHGPGVWLNSLTGHYIGPDDVTDDRIHWVIVGGESGPDARPMHPDWARQLRDQCTAAGVPFMFKQWGGATSKAGGRELDGRTWDQYPTTTAAPR